MAVRKLGLIGWVIGLFLIFFGQLASAQATSDQCMAILGQALEGAHLAPEESCTVGVLKSFACPVPVYGFGYVTGVCTEWAIICTVNSIRLPSSTGCFAMEGGGAPTLSPINSNRSPQCQANSTINIDTAALDETIDIIGAPFSLTYASDRFRQAFSYSTKSLGLGGWTPTILHHYDTINKILYTGDGGLRPVAAQSTSSGYYLASEDGSEVYYFDSSGKHLSTKDALTGVTKYTFTYDSLGRVSAIADNYGNTTTLQYSGTSIIMTSPYGQETLLTLDTSGNLASVTSPNGATHAMTYDSSGNLLSFEKPMGQKSQVTYDASGFVLKDLGAGGDFLALARVFDPTTGIQTVTTSTAMGRQSIYATTASTDGSTHSITDPFGGSSNSSDNNQGPNDFSSSIGVTNNSTLSADPRFGWMAPFASATTYAVANSNIDATTSTTMSAPLTDSSNPFSFQTLTSSTTLQGDASRTFTSNFTPSSNTLTSTSPLGRVTTSQLNSQGDIASLQVGNLTPASFNYDSRGRLTNLNMGPRQMNFTYDNFGNIASSQDFLGQTTSYTYDPDGHLLTETRPDGSAIEFTYDLNGNMTSITPPSRPAHNFTYNLFELVASYLPPSLGGLNVATNYQYNLDKQLTEIDLPTGQSVTFNYGATTGLLNSITAPNGSYNYTYDPNSNLISQIVSPDGETLSYQYLGNILATVSSSGPVTNSVSLTYNTDGTVASITPKDSAGNGITEPISYDKDGLVTGVGDLAMTLDQNGEVSATDLGAIHESLAYNSFGEMTGDKFTYTSSFGHHHIRGLFDEHITRDNLGRIIEVDQGHGDNDCDHDDRDCDHDRDNHWGDDSSRTQYVYDNLGRLTEVFKNRHLERKYVYDENGNRVEKIEDGRVIKATYDNQDRLLTYGNTEYQYDNNGTLTAKIVHVDRDNHQFEQKSLGRWLTSFFDDHDRDQGDHDGDHRYDRDDHQDHDRTLTTTYNYDVFGNLKSVNLPDGRVISYIVDGQNRRVGKLVNGKLVQQFVYQSQTEVAAELDGNGNVIEQFIYGSKDNVPDYMIMNGHEYRVVSNQVGTPMYIVDTTNGKVVERETMDEFGCDEDFHGHTMLPFGFAGGIYDRDTGLVRFGTRDFDPMLARWISTKDPLLFGGGSTNLYEYSLDNPVNFFDPSGEATCTYDVAKHTMTCVSNDGKSTFSSSDFVSGLPISQNFPPGNIIHDIGPIPPGVYNIGFLKPGSTRRPLTPISGTNTYGRGSFQTHACPNTLTCSHGCVASPSIGGFNNFINNDIGPSVLNVK